MRELKASRRRKYFLNKSNKAPSILSTHSMMQLIQSAGASLEGATRQRRISCILYRMSSVALPLKTWISCWSSSKLNTMLESFHLWVGVDQCLLGTQSRITLPRSWWVLWIWAHPPPLVAMRNHPVSNLFPRHQKPWKQFFAITVVAVEGSLANPMKTCP